MNKTISKFNVSQYETEKISITTTQEILDSRKESLFYYGQVAEVKHTDHPKYTISIEANGEIRLYDKEELLREGELPFESDDPKKTLMTDRDLVNNIRGFELESPVDANYEMGNNNWYEVIILKEDEDFISWADDVYYTIDDVLADIAENFEDFITSANFN